MLQENVEYDAVELDELADVAEETVLEAELDWLDCDDARVEDADVEVPVELDAECEDVAVVDGELEPEPDRAKYAAPPATTTMITTITASAVVAMPRSKRK